MGAQGVKVEIERVFRNIPDPQARTERDALFVWSTIHGFSSIHNSHAWERLEFSEDVRANGVETISQHIRDGLGASDR
jgi:hypothetical protein